MMKLNAFLTTFCLLVMLTKALAADVKSTVKFDRDPESLKDFQQLVRKSARDGAVRVKFLSGEWNWYCSGCDHIPRKEFFSKWDSGKNGFSKNGLESWLKTNNVNGVQIYIASDADVKTYFHIEQILRKNEVHYWVVSLKPEKSRGQGVYLFETDGRAVADYGPLNSEVEERLKSYRKHRPVAPRQPSP